MPCLQATPDFLKKSGYANPDNVVKSPFQIAFNTELPAFVWAQGRPDLMQDFGLWMGSVHDGQKNWLGVCNFKDLIQGSKPDTPIFVDIGGGLGHQCALLKTVSGLVGRVILEDLAIAIEHSLPMEGVEKIAFDFWSEQPIKGRSSSCDWLRVVALRDTYPRDQK